MYYGINSSKFEIIQWCNMNEQSRETVTHPLIQCMCDSEWNQQYESWNRATDQRPSVKVASLFVYNTVSQ